jgi:hypothetical protein
MKTETRAVLRAILTITLSVLGEGRLPAQSSANRLCSTPVADGLVSIGGGNTLGNASDFEGSFPKQYAGIVRCFGLPEPAQQPAPESLAAEQAREEYAYTIGVQAYIYGYPLVEMYRIRFKAVFDPENKNRVPLNQFRHMRALLDHTATTVVAPNNDTLYSSAWLDLAQEPLVLDVPDTGGRYYVMQFMDFYTNNFAYVGKRSTGTAPGSYAIVGPGWQGTLPDGLQRVSAPTNAVWLLGRTLVDSKDDLTAAHAVQDQYLLTPLSRWGKSDQPKPHSELSNFPPYDLSEPLKFFELLSVALHENPPPTRDGVLMNLFGQVGVGPGKTFRVDDLDAATARGLRKAIDSGRRLISALPSGRPVRNGWLAFSPHTGKFGDDYRYRAYVAMSAIAANDPAEAFNFSARQDDQGRPLHGDRKYLVRFEKGQVPPVDAFWSLTLYRLPGVFFVENALGRYALGDRSRQLRYEPDGALEIYVQHDSPGKDKESNWLPAAQGDFSLALRCYLPRKAIVDGAWMPPTVKAVE